MFLPQSVVTSLPSTDKRPKPSTLRPNRYSPVAVGVREPVHSTDRPVIPFACSGTLLSLRFTEDSTLEVRGVGLASKLGRELYSTLTPGLPSGVVRTGAGTGSALFERN